MYYSTYVMNIIHMLCILYMCYMYTYIIHMLYIYYNNTYKTVSTVPAS